VPERARKEREGEIILIRSSFTGRKGERKQSGSPTLSSIVSDFKENSLSATDHWGGGRAQSSYALKKKKKEKISHTYRPVQKKAIDISSCSHKEGKGEKKELSVGVRLRGLKGLTGRWKGIEGGKLAAMGARRSTRGDRG